MTIDTYPAAPRARGLLARWRAARRSPWRDPILRGLSRHMLRDIGLERDDRYPPDPMLGPWI